MKTLQNIKIIIDIFHVFKVLIILNFNVFHVISAVNNVMDLIIQNVLYVLKTVYL